MAGTLDNKHYYSLWLMPEAGAAKRIQEVIAELALRHNTSPFEPHVTLLGMIFSNERRALEKTKQLAKEIRSLRMTPIGIGHSDSYNHSVFVRMEITAEVGRAHELAAHSFRKRETDFMPHLSLIYSNMGEEDQMEVIRKLNKRTLDLLRGIDMDRLCLYCVEGEVRRWKMVGGFGLGDAKLL
jgi:2'-5' RNA ligase